MVVTFLPAHAGDRSDAGARCLAIDVARYSPAERHAAAELRAGHVQGVAQDQSSGMSGLTSTVCGLPFKVKLVAMESPL